MNANSSSAFIALLTVGFALALTSCDKLNLSGPVSFPSDIKPILAHCVECHQSNSMFGELNLENRELAFKPRAKGPVVTPGHPEQSPLYLVLRFPEGDNKAMPPTGHRISREETALIKRWIDQGAPWPAGPDGVITPTAMRDPKGA